MKNYTLFSFEFLFSDHFAKLSDQAKWYYINLNFYAEKGFVSNPLQVLDLLGYDKSVLNELKANEDVLCLPNRDEIFITAYFLHNHGNKPGEWVYSPFAVYWQGKLFVKKNGMATFKKQEEPDPVDSTNDDDKPF